MKSSRSWTALLFGLALCASPAWAAELTAVTLFGCNEQGTVDPAFRFNSGPIDAAWDLFLYEGPAFNPATDDPQKIKWLNDRTDHTIRIPLTPGLHTFTFHCECGRTWPRVGLNLFRDGVYGRAAISVQAAMDTHGPPYPAFTPNSAQQTMGWPITDVPAAGSLSTGGPDAGIWDFAKTGQDLKITLTSFRCSAPNVDGNLDLVGQHKIGASGKPDMVGQFVLKVEPAEADSTRLAGLVADGGWCESRWTGHGQRVGETV